MKKCLNCKKKDVMKKESIFCSDKCRVRHNRAATVKNKTWDVDLASEILSRAWVN